VSMLMLWLVIILIVLIMSSLMLALKFLVFKASPTGDTADLIKNEKKIVSLLTLRVIFSFILLFLCYLHLS
jgi:hypothetical protein